MSDMVASWKYASAPVRYDGRGANDNPALPAGEFICRVISNEWVNEEYKLMALEAPPKALTARAGQFFQLLCPSPDGTEVWARRPMSVYVVDAPAGRLEFLYKVIGRGTEGMAKMVAGDEFNIAGPFGNGFSLDPAWKNIVVIGRGVGLATMAPISQLAADNKVAVTAILSARKPELAMSADLFERIGATVIPVLDSDGSSAVENVERLLEGLIAEGKVDAFYTCGSNRLLMLVKRLGKKYGIPGQVAMEQIMACGVGPCYICVKTFEVNGKKVLRRVCREGPVFDVQEAVGW